MGRSPSCRKRGGTITGDLASVRAIISGHVQGVFFRAFTLRQAAELGLKGHVRNLPTGEVEVEAEGPRGSLETLIESLKTGPSGARVESVSVRWSDYRGEHDGFSISY